MGAEKSPFLLPVERDRDATHRNVEIVGLEILRKLWPGRFDIVDLDAERFAQSLGHVDVEAAEFAGGAIEQAEGRVVAGHADTERAALHDFIEARGLLGLRGASVQDNGGDEADENSKHRAFRRWWQLQSV